MQPAAQSAVAGHLPASGEVLDLLFHGLGPGVDVEAAAVREAGAVGGVERVQGQPVGHGLADCGEGFLQEVGHGEHGRAGVEAVAVTLDEACPAAGAGVAFDEGDMSSRSEEVQGR